MCIGILELRRPRRSSRLRALPIVQRTSDDRSYVSPPIPSLDPRNGWRRSPAAAKNSIRQPRRPPQSYALVTFAFALRPNDLRAKKRGAPAAGRKPIVDLARGQREQPDHCRSDSENEGSGAASIDLPDRHVSCRRSDNGQNLVVSRNSTHTGCNRDTRAAFDDDGVARKADKSAFNSLRAADGRWRKRIGLTCEL